MTFKIFFNFELGLFFFVICSLTSIFFPSINFFPHYSINFLSMSNTFLNCGHQKLNPIFKNLINSRFSRSLHIQKSTPRKGFLNLQSNKAPKMLPSNNHIKNHIIDPLGKITFNWYVTKHTIGSLEFGCPPKKRQLKAKLGGYVITWSWMNKTILYITISFILLEYLIFSLVCLFLVLSFL